MVFSILAKNILITDRGSRKDAAMTNSLPGQIEELSRYRIIVSPFRVADIAAHFGTKYLPNYIHVVLSNFAEDTGNYVKRRTRPRFRRVGHGLCELV